MDVILPYETIYQIALDLPLKSLSSLCKTSSIFSNICNDDIFWKNRLMKYFSNLSGLINTNISSYKELYKWIVSIKIGHNIAYPPSYDNTGGIFFIKPIPPYTVTPISGEYGTYMALDHDVMISYSKTYNRWYVYEYVRNSTNEQRNLQDAKITLRTKEDLENKINQLIAEGYYQLTNPYLSHENFDIMQKKGLIGLIHDSAII